MLIEYARAQVYVKGARRKLRQLGFNTAHIPVWISWVDLYSYCEDNRGEYCITLGLNALRGEYCQDSRGVFLRSLAYHEFGHAWLWAKWPKFNRADRVAWRRLFGDYAKQHTFFQWFFLSKEYDDTEYVSYYAALEPQEDWAETFAVWARHPNKHKKMKGTVQRKLELVDTLVRRYS